MERLAKWIKVSKSEPCVICSRCDWCTRSADGAAVRCMRVQSDRPCKGDAGGWLHKLGDTTRLAPVEVKEQVRPDIDWGKEARRMFNALGVDKLRAALAEKLGVSERSLWKLGVGKGHDRIEEFASFPMRNESKQITGITRRYLDGRKKTMRWSRAGLFYALDWHAKKGPILLPEGASDTAALITLGLGAIGRFQNTGSVSMLARMLADEKRPIVVLGEMDEAPDRRGKIPSCTLECLGCHVCWPGKFGAIETARRLSKALRRKVNMKMPPDGAKDVRAWLNSGHADGAEFLQRLWK